MIRLCTCTEGSSSSPVNYKHQESSKACKSCGGKLSVDRCGALSGSMLSTVGLELSRVIDPHLNWKTTSKGRHRAVRRARTSFTGGNKKKSTAKSSQESGDLTDKDSKRTSDTAVSESEKLGVSILGRRFSDTLESVPIKKRRILLVRSPSPPSHLSSHSDDSNQIRESHSASYEEVASYINSGVGTELGKERSFAGEGTNSGGLHEKLCDTADFSGISILAAAACDSNIGSDGMNAEDSVSQEHSSQGEKDEQFNTKEDLDGKTDIPLEASTTLVVPCEESDGIKVDGSCSLGASTSSLQNVPNKMSRVELSSCDDRLHWDLNTVMDAWESHNNEVPNSEPHAANIIGEVCDEKLGSVELHENQMVFADTNCATELFDSRDLGDVREDCALEETEVQEKPIFSGDTSVADHNERKACFSLPHGGDPVQEEHELGDASYAMVDAAEETKPLHDQEKKSSFTTGVPSPARGALVPARDSSLVTAAIDEEKADAHCVGFDSVVETEVSHSPPVPCENASFDHSPHPRKPHAVVDQIAEVVYEENTVAASAADLDEHSAHCSLTDVRIGQASNSRSSRAEKHASLHAYSANDQTDRCSVANHLAENTSCMMVDGNICKDMTNTAGSGGSAHTDAFDETACGSAGKFKETSISPFLSDSHTFNFQGSSNHDGLRADEHETSDADIKTQDDKCSLLIDETLKTTKADSPVHIEPEVPVCNSAHVKPGMVDIPPLDGALNSHGDCNICVDGYVTRTGQIAFEGHSDSDYYSDASQIDTDQPNGMEKVEFLGDEDYQYEDGEFRESFVNSWGEDGAEEGETEYVDYGSDNRETDIFEAASDFPASVSLHADGVEDKTGGLSDADQDIKYASQIRKETEDAVSQPLMKCSSDAGSAKRKIKDGSKKLERDGKEASDSGGVNNKIIGEREFLIGDVASRKSSHLASYRMKLSGWDRLPEGCKGSGSEVMESGVDFVRWNHTDASLDAGESLRRVVGSSSRRDLSARVERRKSSDVSHRKDKSYARASRSNDRNDLESIVERDTGAPRSVGRGRSSLHMHGRGRHDRWLDSPNHCGPNHHDSHGCYGPASFTHPASKNAAAAAVAKLESSGFVVAADGTILKAGGARPVGQVPRRSANASSHSAQRSLVGRRSSAERNGAFGMPLGIGNSRETSPDRHISIGRGRAPARCGPGMVSTVHRERYHGPMLNDSRDAPLPLPHQSSRREQSFSPHRRPLHRSCTISPLRSRTRSPRMCTSPRARNDSGMNGGPGLRPRSRSPNFKSEVRSQRLRSPHRQSGLVERMVGYAPSSRNHTSPPHAARWVEERKDLPNHFREHEPNRFSGRSPPRRVFSRNHRLDLIDSPGRAKSNEYYRSMHSGTFPEFGDFDRGYDGLRDDRRGYGNKCEMLHPMRQYDTDGNMKRFMFDAEVGLRVHNPRPRSSEFQRRGSPRGFDRGIENQLGHSPRRVKEEKVNIRYVKRWKA